jgi:hypothetical protein
MAVSGYTSLLSIMVVTKVLTISHHVILRRDFSFNFHYYQINIPKERGEGKM